MTRLLIGNKAVATNGNYRRGIKIGNEWFSHIVAPRTGQPVNQLPQEIINLFSRSEFTLQRAIRRASLAFTR